MATVGLNFGSATSGAGFDVAATVTSILAISQGVETPWKSQLTTMQAQDTALTVLGTNLSSLANAVSSLTDFQGALASKQGSSSDANVLALSSATPMAVSGSHSITVTSLAQTSSVYSAQIATATDTLSGSVSIQIGGGTVQSVTIDPSNNTLQTLAASINAGSYGVTASLVSDAHGTRLSLVSTTSGADGQIALTGNLIDAPSASRVGFSSGQTGLDAVFNVDGLDTTSASNTVTGAISGVTFQLLAPSSKAIQVQIANNNSSVETAVQSLVTAYNGVISAMKTQESKDSTGKAKPLFGSPTLALIQEQLSSSMLSGKASGSINNIGQLGLSLKQDGTLSLDVSTLDTALNTHFTAIQGFFQNTGSFGQTLAAAMDTLGQSSPTGAITLSLAENSTQEFGLTTNIANEEILIAAQKASLTLELNTANQIMQSIPSQLNSVNEIYSAISGYNKTN